ncbi:MAG: TatD family hydrolase [Lentisphaeria bacterium]|nr:TatD family hydrolase [Lentisphaeria bacterium]
MASDFHTHFYRPGVTALVNGFSADARFWSLPFHPWETAEFTMPEPEKLQACTALGELGFDKFRGAAAWPEKQMEIFRNFLELASDCRKPVVLHACGSFELLYKSVKPFSDLKLLFHGFARHNTALLEELLRHGFFVSLAPALISDEKFRSFLNSHPGCRVGLESDDDENADINEFYSRIAVPGFEKNADDIFREFTGS